MKKRQDGAPLRIICTDRGQHAAANLADYWHGPDDSHRLTSAAFAATAWGPGDHDPDDELRSTVSTTSYELQCWRCGRNPKRQDLLSRFFAPVYDSTRTDRLDISLLDL